MSRPSLTYEIELIARTYDNLTDNGQRAGSPELIAAATDTLVETLEQYTKLEIATTLFAMAVTMNQMERIIADGTNAHL